jgi:glyoxylase-like metal-dependent hydrolase (beta-lactamase superfamily II)
VSSGETTGDAGAEAGADAEAEAEFRALAVAAAAGIHQISLPTPFLIGAVNCYLIEDEPLTLVDTGPNSGNALDELERALDDLGYAVEDLGLIVLTHQHIDHLGLLEILTRRSGAEVAAFHLLGPYLEDFPASAAADDMFSIAVMRRHGVPPELVTALGGIGASFHAFGSSGHVTLPIRSGDQLPLRDRTLQAFCRPGHSPSDTIFWDDERRILVSGDHLLAHVSSNPLISRPLGDPPAGGGPPGAPDRPHALIDYMASMRATSDLPAETVLGGHGPPVLDHVSLIAERFRMHERRAEKILGMLQPGPATAYDLASRMWGNVAVTQAMLTISEVVGHLDILIAEGRVREEADGEVTTFAAV